MDLSADICCLIPSIRSLTGMVRRAYPMADEEDLTQEGCVGLLEAASRYDAGLGASLSTFGKRRAIGAMRDHVRNLLTQRKNLPSVPIEGDDTSREAMPIAAFEPRSVESHEMVLRFARFLRSTWSALPEPAREIIRLRYLEGLSVRDVAQALRISTATVFRRERMGLDWLRERFCECGYGRNLVDGPCGT